MSIGIVGLGYVGLPLAVSFAEAGERVVGVDVDHGRVTALSAGRSPIEDITDGRLRSVLDSCRFTTRAVELHETEAILVCVPTPLTRNREPDLGPLLAAARALADVVRRDQRAFVAQIALVQNRPALRLRGLAPDEPVDLVVALV